MLARIFAQYLAEDWGRPFVVENLPGAGGVIGTQTVARAKPDGATLLMGAVSHSINPALMGSLPYDSVNDFAPVAKLLKFASVLIVHPSVPVGSVNEFVAYAKANPNKLSFALGAIGSSQHLAALQLARQAGIAFAPAP